MIWLSLARRFWPLIAGAALLAIVWLYHARSVSAAHEAGYNKARAEAAAELEAYRQHRDEVEQETQRVHAQNISELETRVARLLRGSRAIRMCEPADEVRDAANPGEPATGPGEGHALRAGRNLQPELVLYGQRCEQLRQQLAAIKRLQ